MSHFPQKTKKIKKNDHFSSSSRAWPQGAFGERFFLLGSAQGASRERTLPGALPERFLKNQGAQFFKRERAP
jgi:hypothetical protein